MTQACRCVGRNNHSAIKTITFADSGNRKGSLYYDGLFTDGKSTVCAGSYLRWRNNAAVYLQRQLGNLKFLGFSLSGLENLAGQLTLLSFLAGGVCAFLSYWNRSDNSYIVLYGAAGILGGMLTIVADYGVNLEGKRNQLLISLQDHLENVMWPRLERESSSERASAVTEAEERRDGGTVRTIGRDRDRRLSGARRGAEQTAASRENAREASNRDKKEDRSAKDWLDDLNPEQKRMLGEMLKGFL